MPISVTQDNQKYYLHYDQVGTLRAVSDINYNIIKDINYDTFGNILQDTNTNLNIPFGFAGGLHDRSTNLVHFGYREYDPYTGKWTSKDPIDFGGGDSNLYGYVLNDPTNLVDPSGLILPALTTGAGAIAGGIAGALTGAACEAYNGGDFESIKNAAIASGLFGFAAGAIAGSGGAAAPWIGMGLDLTANATNALMGASK